MLRYFDYRPGYLELKEQIDDAIRRVLDSGQLILGPEVRAFEQEFAAYVGVPGAVGVNSGTDALILALRSLGVGSDAEVITVANAGVPPVAAIRAAGATPRFVDVDPETLLMDPAQLEGARTERTRCVLPVHLYGQPAPLAPILEFAERHGLEVIEDCAQAHGAIYCGAHVGGFGSVGCFSFYPTKNLGAFGDGGLLTTNDAELAERLSILRVHGSKPKYYHELIGINSRLDALQAAVLRVKFRHLPAWSDARRANAAVYDRAFAEAGAQTSAVPLAEGGFPLRTPQPPQAPASHIYNQYVIRVPAESRDSLREHLRTNGIGSEIYYPVPLHRQGCFGYLGEPVVDLSESELAAAETLALPIFPELSEQQLGHVLKTVIEFVGRSRTHQVVAAAATRS